MEDWRIGVDIGGTFMDFCALEVATGRTASLKVLTTPEDPGAELRQGLDLLAQREGIPATAITRFVHGTTVGINTIIQRKGARLALLTNDGFEDVIELARPLFSSCPPHCVFNQANDAPRDRIDNQQEGDAEQQGRVVGERNRDHLEQQRERDHAD